MPASPRYVALANRQEEIREANGELVGLFYYDVVLQTKLPASETSEMMDKFGWRGGWRMEDLDNEDGTMEIFHSAGDGGGIETRFLRRFPIVYVIETATMRVVAGEKLDEFDVTTGGAELDVLAEVKRINNKD